MADTFAQFVRKLDDLSIEIESVSERTVKESSALMRKVGMGFVAEATGGDFTLSGMSRSTGLANRPKPIGVVSKTVTIAGVPAAFVSMTGPAPLIERDQYPHFVFSRYARADGFRARTKQIGGRRGKRVDLRSAAKMLGLGVSGGQRAVLHWGGNYRAWTVASSKGRHPWAHTVETVVPKIPEIAATNTRRALGSVFK